MRKIYFIRHCQPEETSEHRCISQTDLPLNAVGIEQTSYLSRWFFKVPVEVVYVSPLLRCQMTAEKALGDRKIEICSELTEISVGDWEGLPFDEIKEKWPKEYEMRGLHMGTCGPPGGESLVEGAARMEKALILILSKSHGDIALVTHCGILRGWLCKILQKNPDDVMGISIPIGSITEVHLNDDTFQIRRVGEKPNKFPGSLERKSLFQKCNTQDEVVEHLYAVAHMAREIASNKRIDKRLLNSACILHDICRSDGRKHPETAAKLLKKAGYEKLAKIIEQHHDLSEDSSEEAEILYLADKMIQGSKKVSIEERFKESLRYCMTDEAKTAWQRRYDTAVQLLNKYKR